MMGVRRTNLNFLNLCRVIKPFGTWNGIDDRMIRASLVRRVIGLYLMTEKRRKQENIQEYQKGFDDGFAAFSEA